MSNKVKRMSNGLSPNYGFKLQESEPAPKRKLIFPVSMYSNIYGSVVISVIRNHIYNHRFKYLLMALFKKPNPLEDKIREVNTKWNKLVSEKRGTKAITWNFEDPEFFEKTVKYFGLEMPKKLRIACVMDRYGVLFAPYIHKKVLPLREDGFVARTLRVGKVYPLKLDKKKRG